MKAILGFEGFYSASDDGRIFSHRKGAYLAPCKTPAGYEMVSLSAKGKLRHVSVHTLVMEAFVGRRGKGMHIDHINGVRDDNRLSNLRYATPKENIAYTVARGAHAHGSKNGQAKLTPQQVAEIFAAASSGKRYWGANEMAKRLGVTSCQIRRALHGRTYKAEGAAAIRRGS